jgi:hypothetical protein
MNRETVLYPVSWPKNQWPICDPVRGIMSGPLPPRNLNIAGPGAFVKDPDYYNFAPGSAIPLHFTYWRFPHTQNYGISPPGHPYTLALTPSNANLTGFPAFAPLDGQTFIGRRQVDTLFTYSVDLSFSPSKSEEEAGVTVFLNQEANVDLGVVYLDGSAQLRFRGRGFNDVDVPTIISPLPKAWYGNGVHLQIRAINFTHYSMSYGSRGGRGALTQVAVFDNALFSTSFTGMTTPHILHS